MIPPLLEWLLESFGIGLIENDATCGQSIIKYREVIKIDNILQQNFRDMSHWLRQSNNAVFLSKS